MLRKGQNITIISFHFTVWPQFWYQQMCSRNTLQVLRPLIIQAKLMEVFPLFSFCPVLLFILLKTAMCFLQLLKIYVHQMLPVFPQKFNLQHKVSFCICEVVLLSAAVPLPFCASERLSSGLLPSCTLSSHPSQWR